MDPTGPVDTWRIGELAGMARVSVRTLRHYEALGLLTPTARTESGYRLYGLAQVDRLYRILALRSLDLSLEEIGRLLRDDVGLADVLARQLQAIERRMAADAELQARLHRLLEASSKLGEPTVTELTDTMEAMAMSDRYYTQEQQEALAQRRDALGPEGMRAAERAWADLIAEAEAERAAGTDPAAPRMQKIARRWRALIEGFTGGDPAVRESLGRMYREEGVERASRGAVSSDLMAYVGRALSAREG
ncbi:MAG TPA: MerR family transcriptional regulator [Gaiellales bacterium]|jgi:DNA-binding transcriptional MerR regulator|nr:MerR family transcriptional regulator [Gaiellales bacterium]